MPDSKFPLPGRIFCFGTAPAVVTSLLLLDGALLLAALLPSWGLDPAAVAAELLGRLRRLLAVVAWVLAVAILLLELLC